MALTHAHFWRAWSNPCDREWLVCEEHPDVLWKGNRAWKCASVILTTNEQVVVERWCGDWCNNIPCKSTDTVTEAFTFNIQVFCLSAAWFSFFHGSKSFHFSRAFCFFAPLMFVAVHWWPTASCIYLKVYLVVFDFLPLMKSPLVHHCL